MLYIYIGYKQWRETMTNLINISIALITTALVIASPVLISLAFYQVNSDLAGAGLAIGLFAGPYSVIKLIDIIN